MTSKKSTTSLQSDTGEKKPYATTPPPRPPPPQINSESAKKESPKRTIESIVNMFSNDDPFSAMDRSMDKMIKSDSEDNLSMSNTDDCEETDLELMDSSNDQEFSDKIPILTNTTLNVIRLFGKYLHMSTILHVISSDVIVYMMKLFYFYFYYVYINFAKYEVGSNGQTIRNTSTAQKAFSCMSARLTLTQAWSAILCTAW